MEGMIMDKTIAILASLDTKLSETLYAKKLIEDCGVRTLLIDMSTVNKDRGAAYGAVSPEAIIAAYGMEWKDFAVLGKAGCIETMSKALEKSIPEFYEKGMFDALISIGGGQNARMAASAAKALPFGVPKIIASSLACGKRTMEQYVGNKDVMVMHTVADISGLNSTTECVIANACHAAVGMVSYPVPAQEKGRTRIAATMLGITSKGVEGSLRLLDDDKFEKTCFHANGVGGRCMEDLIRAGRFSIVADLTLHEITGEIIGGYCQGADNRLMAAIESRVPMVVAPGAIDMLDFFIDEQGNGLPADIDRRKKIYHNSSIVHTKIYPDEAVKLAEVLAERLNKAEAPVILILPDEGFCEAAAKGGAMYDPESDKAFIDTIRKHLDSRIRVVDVHGNFNSPACQKAIADAVMSMEQAVSESKGD